MCSEKRYRTYRDYIQQYLEDYLKRFEAEPQKQIFEAMKYSLLAGGKRIRPILPYSDVRILPPVRRGLENSGSIGGGGGDDSYLQPDS